jgi:hypothetical protein
MFKSNKYSYSNGSSHHYNSSKDNGEYSTLKYENYKLVSELEKLKKKSDLLQQEKKTLENRLNKVDLHALKVIPEISRKVQKIPENIENLLDQMEGNNLKKQLLCEFENLLSCLFCVVCNENVKALLYIECRHLAVCVSCGKNLPSCPLCRKMSKTIVVYR